MAKKASAGGGLGSIFLLLFIAIPLGIALIIAGHVLRAKSYRTNRFVPSPTGYGYLNRAAVNLDQLVSSQCTVTQPSTDCFSKYTKGTKSSRGYWTRYCYAVVSYMYDGNSTTGIMTNTTQRTRTYFRDNSQYNFYSIGEQVPCYTDAYRYDMISYYKYQYPELKGRLGLIISGWILLGLGVFSWALLFGLLFYFFHEETMDFLEKIPRMFSRCCSRCCDSLPGISCPKIGSSRRSNNISYSYEPSQHHPVISHLNTTTTTTTTTNHSTTNATSTSVDTKEEPEVKQEVGVTLHTDPPSPVDTLPTKEAEVVVPVDDHHKTDMYPSIVDSNKDNNNNYTNQNINTPPAIEPESDTQKTLVHHQPEPEQVSEPEPQQSEPQQPETYWNTNNTMTSTTASYYGDVYNTNNAMIGGMSQYGGGGGGYTTGASPYPPMTTSDTTYGYPTPIPDYSIANNGQQQQFPFDSNSGGLYYGSTNTTTIDPNNNNNNMYGSGGLPYSGYTNNSMNPTDQQQPRNPYY